MILFIHMLPKKLRLSRQEFKNVMKDGKMASGELMGILAIRNQESGIRDYEDTGAGLIVSKKLSNKAVVRNKLKRRLRAALQIVLPEINPQLYFVILPNRRAIGATVEELKNEIGNILQK